MSNKKIENLNEEVKKNQRRKGVISIIIILFLLLYGVFKPMSIYFYVVVLTWFLYSICRNFSDVYYWESYKRLCLKHEEEFKETKVNSKYADNLWNLLEILDQVARMKKDKGTIFKATHFESYWYVIGKEKITPSKFRENSEYYTELFDNYIERKTILGNLQPKNKILK